MADFYKAYKKLEVAEGGYVNDPDDAGGETYKGVSRKANPYWIGWTMIDDIKKHHPTTFKSIIKATPQVEKAVQDLYKGNYWDCFGLDDFKSQGIAEQLFDMCVNAGKTTAVKIAQRVIGDKEDGKWSTTLKERLANLT